MSLQILMQVLDGLEYAHEARGIDGRPLKVVHRDLTPSNIIVTAHGVVKILDFGIAKAADSHSFTRSASTAASSATCRPSSCAASAVDARADIFSVGVILAEAAINNRFWGESTMPNIAQRLGAGDLPSLADREGVDPALRRICERALTADRDDRYASAAAFKSDLNVFLHTLGGSVSREELAAFVCETVKEDRARLQEVIDSQLARNSAPVINASSSTLPRFEQTPVASIYNQTFKDASPGDEPEVTIEKEPEPVAAAATPKHLTIPPAVEPTNCRSRLAPAACRSSGWSPVAPSRIGAVVLFVALRSPHDAPPPPAPVPAAAIPAPAPPPIATTARVEVIVSPADATLELDGQPLGSNPYVGRFPRDANAHELVVKAAGYLPMNRRFTLEQDLSLQLQLTKAAIPRPAATPPTAAAIVAAPVRPRTPPPPTARAPGAAPSPPPQPAVTAIAPVATVAPPAPPPDKRSLDPNVYAPDKKRTLDRMSTTTVRTRPPSIGTTHGK